MRRLIASSPAASVACLEVLARDADAGVRHEVARNPAAGSFEFADSLRVLGFDEDPSVRSAVARISLDLDVIERLTSDPAIAVRRAVARNPATPAALLVRLLEGTGSRVAQDLAANHLTPASVLERIARSHLHRFDIAVRVAENRNADGETLKVLAASRWGVVRHRVAAHSRTPAATLEGLARDVWWRVRPVANANLRTRS